MPRTHPPYAPEYRRRIIELARTRRPIAQLALAAIYRRMIVHSGRKHGRLRGRPPHLEYRLAFALAAHHVS